MSESRNCSESRGCQFSTPIKKLNISENNGENKGDFLNKIEDNKQVNNKYNNLEDIDSLIEKLESDIPSVISKNHRINQALEKRKEKIEELKRLRNQAKIEIEEERLLKVLEDTNDELDVAISNVKKLIKKPINDEKEDTYEEPIRYVRDSEGESHFSSESRW